MKKLNLYLVYLLLFSSLGANAQTTIQVEIDQPATPLLIDAGIDQAYDGNAPIILGGAPTASGANGNYTYNWTPVEFLDNPTASNPTVINLIGPTTFSVSVSADGALCEKTAEVFVEYNTVGIEEESDMQPHIFPNPFTNTVRFSSKLQVESLVIHDITGNLILIKDQNHFSNDIIDVSGLGAGMYFFTFIFLDNNQTTLKLCKLY